VDSMPSNKFASRSRYDTPEELNVPLLAEGENDYEESSTTGQPPNRAAKSSKFQSCCSWEYFKTLPHFLMIVSFVDVLMMAIAIYLNHGFEPLSVNPLLGPSSSVLEQMGAKDVSKILDGQWWRFITPIFLHAGLFHLAANLFFQLRTGMALERNIGSLRMAALYLICGVGGNLSSAIFLPHLLSVGASGALFGIIGTLLAISLKTWSVQERPCLNLMTILLTIVINLTIGLLPVVDNFCHLGGFTSGFCLACVALPMVVVDSKSRRWSTPQPEERYFHLAYFTKRNVVFLVGGLIGLLVYFVGGFYLFANHIDGNKWCNWCSNITCPQVWSWCASYN